MSEFTQIWTRDGREWTVRGDAEDVHKAVCALAANESMKWVNLEIADGRRLRIRKDFIGTILPAA